MCFRVRISSPFHLNTLNIPIQNIKCPKNTKNACADIIFSPANRTWTILQLLLLKGGEGRAKWPMRHWYQLSRVEDQDLSLLLALNNVIFTSCIPSPFSRWLWALKWRRDDGWNTWKHISCFEEEITKLCNHYHLWTHIPAQSIAPNNVIHG